MRIVIVGLVDFPDGRGAARHLHMLARGLVAQGHQISVIIPFAMRPGPATQRLDGIEVTWCYVPQRERSPREGAGIKVHLLSRLKLVYKICLMSAQKDYDWVHLYHPGLEGVLMAVTARLAGRRVSSEYGDIVWSRKNPDLAHRIADALTSLANVWVPRLSSVVFALNTSLEGTLRYVAPRTRVVLVPQMIDVNLFAGGNGERFRRAWGLCGHKLVVYSGTFWVGEGLANLVEAMSLVIRKHKDVKLVIAGGTGASTDADDVNALVEQYELAGRVVLPGHLPLAGVVDLLAAADVLVVSKLDNAENRAAMPIKVVEYLAAGRPIVSSCIGDIPIYLHHGETALLCEPGNVPELAECICTLLSDRELADRIARQGQRLAYEVFDVASNTARMLTAMEQAD